MVEIYDDPAVALIYAIVEGSTNYQSSDEEVSDVIDDSRRRFQLIRGLGTETKEICYYNKYAGYMASLYIYKFMGGTMKQFCKEMGIPYMSVCVAINTTDI